MLVNWFKHNFKSSKKVIQAVNKELKDVKDKEFLKMLYDFCVKRQYPMAELFNGVVEMEVEAEKDKSQVKECVEAAQEIKEEVTVSVRQEENSALNPVDEQSIFTEVPMEVGTMVFSKPQKRKKGLRKHKRKEEI